MFYTILQYIAITLGILYLILILSYIYGWNKISIFKNSGIKNYIFVSIIIPVRNEENNINNIINDILEQDYGTNNFEIIIVDDKSEDSTYLLAEKFYYTHKNIKLISLNGCDSSGKKRALILGIKEAKGNLIITTDADCRVSKLWLSTIVSFYEKEKPKIIVAPVIFKSGNNIFHQFQSLEFLSLIASTAGAIGIKRPIMCNGANLAFEKNTFYEFNDALNKASASGDDVLFLLNVKKKYKNFILFLKSVEATAVTNPQFTLKNFINQRIRWISKSKRYKDFDIINSAIIVFLLNSFLLFAFISSWLNINILYIFLSLFIFKSIVDIALLYRVTSFFNKQKLLLLFFLFQLIYLFYVSIIGILGNIKKFKWKNRLYKI